MPELYIIPNRSCIEESMQLADEYRAHFEYNDFFSPDILDDKSKTAELTAFYRALDRDRSKDTLHGAFLDVTIHSEDKKIREISELRVRQSMEIATDLRIRGVIFHTNSIPNFKTQAYVRHWLESNTAFWKEMLSEYPNTEILIENMFDEDPDLSAELAKQMADEPRFGICLDYAHASAFGNRIEIAKWVEKLLPYTHHMHINDNDLKNDLHQAIGSGKIDWSRFTQLMKKFSADCSVLIETTELSKQRASLEYMRQNDIYPFNSFNQKEGALQ